MNKKIMNYAAVGAYALGLFGLNSCLNPSLIAKKIFSYFLAV